MRHLLLPSLAEPGPKRERLEAALRDAVRTGRLAAGARLPSSRALAEQLGVSRRLVTDAYAQLIAEGYLVAHVGSGTRVAATNPAARDDPHGGEDRWWAQAQATLHATALGRAGQVAPVRFDLHPGQPDLSLFPRRDWLRAVKETLAAVPDARLGYEDPAGARELREALGDHLGRVRGALARPERIVVTSGYAQGLRILADTLAAEGVRRVAVEDPGYPVAGFVLRAAGVEPVPVPVDARGLDVEALAATDVRAVLVTPAHQLPTGVVLAPERRTALLAWARAVDGLVIEDDYDAEFRYDREPVGVLQGLEPDRVALCGTASKSLAPALRIGWVCAPARWIERLRWAKAAADMGSGALDQQALARLFATGAYERHLRRARQRYRGKRAALIAAVGRSIPGARVTGTAAGLHAVVLLPPGVDETAVVAGALDDHGIRVFGLRHHFARPAPPAPPALIVGYAGLSEAELGRVVAALGECVRRALPAARPARRSGRAVASSPR